MKALPHLGQLRFVDAQSSCNVTGTGCAWPALSLFPFSRESGGGRLAAGQA